MRYELPELAPSDFRYCHPIEVRFRDLDAMGHVNNAVYATYFEVARGGYLRALGCWPDEDRDLFERFPFVVLDLYCRFLSPVVIDEGLEVRLCTSHLGSTSFTFDYLISSTRDGRPVARGRSTQVFYDYGAGHATEIPDEMRRAIEAYEGMAD
jgi:acyl-CoA thioester hydrolase